MSNTLRGSQVLWAGGAAVGANGKSTSAYLGALSNVTIFMKNNDGATPTTITVEVAEGQGTAGRNKNPTVWYPLGDTAGTGYSVTLAANVSKAFNIFGLGATFIRLSSSANVDVIASAETSD